MKRDEEYTDEFNYRRGTHKKQMILDKVMEHLIGAPTFYQILRTTNNILNLLKILIE